MRIISVRYQQTSANAKWEEYSLAIPVSDRHKHIQAHTHICALTHTYIHTCKNMSTNIHAYHIHIHDKLIGDLGAWLSDLTEGCLALVRPWDP